MTNYLIVPGWSGSGEKHWQTYFERTQQNFHRVMQQRWDEPNIDEWVENLDKAVSEYDQASVVLVAHSLGCLTVAEWAKRYQRIVKAALLVAPPDTELLHKKLQTVLFEELPIEKINFQTVLVASTNDPWAKIEKAEFYAHKWGSELVNIGNAGHINDLSGHYAWKEGLELLYSLGEAD